MSKFYILPPRHLVGERFAQFLSSVFPGLQWDESVWPDLADALATAAGSHPEIFVLHQEDLGSPGELSLVEDYGAQPGDAVIEFVPGHATPRSWCISHSLASRAA